MKATDQEATERAEFLARRKKGIGGSDAAAVLGCDPYRTAEDLWLEKTGQAEGDDVDNYHKRRGRLFEPVIRRLWSDAHPEYLLEPLTDPPATHMQYPWMIANYDGVAYEPGNPASYHVIEIKCPSVGAYRKIQREGMKEPWIIQMQHYLAVSGCRYGTFVVFCADLCELIEFDVERDETIIATLVEKEREFWILVETMTPPPAIVREFADAPKIEQVGSVTKRGDDDFKSAVAQLREAKELVAVARDVEESAIARVRELVGDTPGIYEGGGARIYYSQQAGRATFDKKKLAAAEPLDREEVRRQVLAMLDPLNLEAHGYDADTIRAWADSVVEESALDLSAFEKVGAPFTAFKPYFIGGA